MKKILGLAVITFAANTWAHGSKSGMTVHAIEKAVENFNKDHQEHAAHFSGVKGWPDGTKIAVRIYIGPRDSIQYSCVEVMENNEEHVDCSENGA
jgi:hypothetical protein